ncbi:DUF1003 domain-containing protein [Microvirga rosea]|uniref:DUF1003 domain-containing protein n=1 Tax=Microvirga rosea TaxID=2715425 RepID=UPI001D0A956E|nr:DUF1003 domain-containing protein [Microvirga rosea]MCB8821949.1 DUF1003 domain-containing protein [Microvirga rosea]
MRAKEWRMTRSQSERPRKAGDPGVSTDPFDQDSFSSVIERNIEVLHRKWKEEERQASLQERIADVVTAFSGSMVFVYLHLAIVISWVLANLGWLPLVPQFDPTFVILATVASVEAIFLSTFVLISQNIAARNAERRSELDLQTNLLSEHEITKLLSLTLEIARHLGIDKAGDASLSELEQHVAPEKVLDQISEKQRSDMPSE